MSARSWYSNPWRRPRFLAAATWAYVAWSLVPVLIAVQFSFNAGRSRSSWQGFSTRWWWGDPYRSVWHDPALRHALGNSLILAVLTMAICAPLGLTLALGLTRWRGHGRRPATMLMALPLVVPEIVIGSTLFLAFTTMYTFVPLGRTAQVLGHVTYNLSTVVIVVRARLLVLGPEYEEAARDLGATPLQALWTILLPLLRPAVFASSMVVFATSLDDFVVSQFLSADAGSETVPMKIYNSFRGTQTPAVNALATLMLLVSAVAVVIAVLTLRSVHARSGTKSAVEELVAIEQ